MKIIIAGCGEMGFHLSKLLAKEEHDIVLIDRDPLVLEKAEALDIMCIVGSATSYKILIQAQIAKAIKSNLNPKYINIFVSGRVENKGKLVVSKSSSLEEALDMAGGTKFLKGKIRFIRVNSDGTIERRNFAFRRNRKIARQTSYVKCYRCTWRSIK